MADLGATFTDVEIAKTEKELKAVYNKAYKDILQKQKDFNEKYKVKEKKKLKQVASGQMTQEEFDHWKKGQIFQGKQWEGKKKQILGTIYKTNDIATGIVNGKTHNVFAFNANYTAYDLEHGAGVNFGFELYDETTVVNLIKNDPQLLPKWKIDQPKDYTWNQKKLNRQVNLGIIEGESLDKIANRLSDALVTQNFNKMRAFARTAMTGAQNSGRQIRLEEAKKLGINLKKEWMATLDAHTRINHRELDGQKVEMEESFEIKGIKIRYPGDPLAPPAMVYNCRCTMVGDLTNYPSTYDRYDNIDGKRIKGMTYKEWEEAKKKGDDISPIPLIYSKLDENVSIFEKQNKPIINMDDYEELSGKELKKWAKDYHEFNDTVPDKWAPRGKGYVKDSDGEKIYYGYVGTNESMRINEQLRKSDGKILEEWSNSKSATDKHRLEVVNALDKAISKNEFKRNTLVRRFVDENYLRETFGSSDIYNIQDKIGSIYDNKGFMSTTVGYNKYFANRPAIITVLCDEGTKAFPTTNYREGEVILNRNTQYELVNVIDHSSDVMKITHTNGQTYEYGGLEIVIHILNKGERYE